MSNEYISEIKKILKTEVMKIGRTKNVTLQDILSTSKTVRNKIRTMEQLIWEVPPVDEDTFQAFFNTARKEYLSINPIKIAPSTSLTRKGLGEWLTNDRHKSINWNYLNRYLLYLEKNGRSKAVINEIERSSRDILSKLGDPESNTSFFVKGLVVGAVQSGKTANFNAVINRSIDAGYQLIIVFSGIMEDLRGQTQDRIESDVVGFGKNLDHNGIKGVGEEINFGTSDTEGIKVIESITSFDSDFNDGLRKGAATLNSPKILVCKKNVSVLRNIINWLGDLQPVEGKQLSIPLLILDDEADNASLNNEGAKGREYASKINGHIRAILAMFEQKSYLGYTASPFANVLQDRNETAENLWQVKSPAGDRTFEQVDNLFPEDFITKLETPTNYIGAKEIFETIAEIPKLPVVSVVSDHTNEFPSRLTKTDETPVKDFPTQQDWDEKVGEFGHYLNFSSRAEYQKGTRASRRDDVFPKRLTRSLSDAVLCFILSIAVRESRIPTQNGSGLFEPHNTMLVHVSRFTTWQITTAELIEAYVQTVASKLQNDKPNEVGSIYIEFEDIWNRYFSDIISNIGDYLSEDYDDQFMVPVTFAVVRNFLLRAVTDLDVLAINSKTSQKLDYATGQPRKIIAVGGNRLSRGFTVRGLTINYFIRSTNYSDTLLQMGRWFGYRPGYLDCCRIFTTRHSIEKFNATTRCIEELETEFDKMNDLEKSPKNFILKVRKDPGVLQITRPSILKNATTVKWSFEDKLEMTTRFDVSSKKISSVWENFRNYTAPLLNASRESDQSFAKVELKGDEIIEFLQKPNNFDTINLDAMIRFIKLCQQSNKLTNWTVALKLTGESKRTLDKKDTNLDIETGLVIRRGPRGPSARQAELRSQFCEEHVFRASGKSANIVSSSRDLAISLSDTEIREAELNFRNKKEQSLLKGGMDSRAAKEKALKTTIPERVYREQIPESHATLLIYLFDPVYCFNQDDISADPDGKFLELIKQGGHDLNKPLVGYAIGFPPINDKQFIGTYMQGDYDLSFDEDIEESNSAEDISIPADESI